MEVLEAYEAYSENKPFELVGGKNFPDEMLMNILEHLNISEVKNVGVTRSRHAPITRDYINRMNKDLYKAIEEGDVKSVETALNKGANPNNIVKSFRRKKFPKEAEEHYVEKDYLLNQVIGTNFDKPKNDKSRQAIIKLLLNKGADPRKGTDPYKNAFTSAIAMCDVKSLKELNKRFPEAADSVPRGLVSLSMGSMKPKYDYWEIREGIGLNPQADISAEERMGDIVEDMERRATYEKHSDRMDEDERNSYLDQYL